MSILKLFSGPPPEKLELQGDALSETGRCGEAKQAYERTLGKLEKQTEANAEAIQRVAGKIRNTKDQLARGHVQAADNYLEGGFVDDARDLLALALEVAEDEAFKTEVRDRLRGLDTQPVVTPPPERFDYDVEHDEPDEESSESSEEEYFHALCGPMPDEVRDAYLEYGKDFRDGFVALNRGDFHTAADSLSRAMTDHPQADSYIPLELGVACLNLGRLSEGEELLQRFLTYHPDALPAYHFLCEIYWEQNAFPKVDALLASVPNDLAGSLAVVLLKGETLFRAGRMQESRDFYRGMIDGYGWNDAMAVALARSCEGLGELEEACNLYKEIMDRCTSCHARIDPMVKHQYAELRFGAGMYDYDLLELYLSLAQEIPDHAAGYHDRISRIYAALGNETEAERFRTLS